MTNHPNIRWRKEAHRQFDEFLESETGQFLLAQKVITRAGMPVVFRDIYLAGFAAGREQNKPRKPDER